MQILEIPKEEYEVAIINSIGKKHKMIRQDSKGPTFALTYQGTWHTLMNNLGLPKAEAKAIEANYHELYAHSDKWVADRLTQATKDGYVTTAFGLRVRTPILHQTMLRRKSTPYEAQAEGRTAGNALGQGYGLLNNRAAIEFQRRVLASPYRLDIRPTMHIHDAQYFIIKEDLDVIHWFNTNLVECVEWQELEELKHDTIKIGGEVDLFYPTWKDAITIPNRATRDEIEAICKQGVNYV